MKTRKSIQFIRFISILFFAFTGMNMNAQDQSKFSLTGQLSDKATNQPIAFATIALRRLADSMLVTGVSSDMDGKFRLEQIEGGRYNLLISSIGYETLVSDINLTGNIETGTLYLQEKSVSLSDVLISGERKKAENGADKITWLVNQKMHDASSTGTDLLGYIPGVSVDLMKNISLAGSQNILILVDGRERERNFVSQLDASRIDKVEIINNPGSQYDASVSGVINIILKKDRSSGINGYINAEVPASSSEIYLFPSYSLSYGKGKLNLYTSWNGEFAYFDILESTRRTFKNNEIAENILSDQVLRQKNWSHRFHYGFDYYLNENNQFNFYAWYNPWSRELDGTTSISVEKDSVETSIASGTKEDTDSNNASFYSVYYRHNFEKPGSMIEFDLSNYHYKGENVTEFNLSSGDQVIERSARVMPAQNTVIFRIDYTSELSKSLRFNAGMRTRFQKLMDRQSDVFSYNENVYALYGTLTYEISKFRFKTGIRAEKGSAEIEGRMDNNNISLLPDATINFRINSRQDLKLSWNRTINRPELYELNPNTGYSDPFSVRSGNPFLKPDFLQNISLRYSKSSGSNFYSFLAYYRKRNNAISSYTFINQNGFFESGEANLGNIRAYGLEITSALKLFKILSMNSSFSLYDLNTSPNSTAMLYGLEKRQKISFETAISAIATFSHDITASLKFHYSTPGTDMQTVTFGDALYFVSLEKSFLKKYKVSINSALPFARSFTYLGYETDGAEFHSRTEGNIQLSCIPLWFTFRYQFNAGRKINRIDRTREEINNMPKKGF